MEVIRIQIPVNAGRIINTLTAAGFEAFAVGGCVRDSILGRTPQDWDITTSARPEQVKGLFGRTVDTGLKHGTVTVLMGREAFEVTTYRIDGKYEDNRHPREVIFTPSLEEDLRRRDLTVNAMAYNEERGLVDLYGGLRDMGEKVIRCVGDPRERFGEDALRMLRAIRFAAQLGYTLTRQTQDAIRQMADTLKNVSPERIQTELVKLICSDHPEKLREAYECGVTRVFLPEFDRAMETPQNHPHHCYSVGEHTLRGLEAIEPDKTLRLTMLFHDVGKPLALVRDEKGVTHFRGHERTGAEMTREILKRLKFDNETVYKVSKLVRYHDWGNHLEPDIRLLRRAMSRMGEDIFPELFVVKRADISAQSEYLRQEKLERLSRWEQLYQEILEKGQCVSLKNLAVTGEDLIGLGMKPGRKLGETLQQLLELVLEEPRRNTREILLAEAEKIILS